MRVFLSFLAVLCAILVLAGSAFAGPLAPPVLKEGVFVYSVPPNFDPPYIGKVGVAELESSIGKLHFPFYVVLVQSSPATSDVEMQAVIDGLAEDWQRLYPDRFRVATSQIAVLSYQPTKFAFLAGSKFKAELGFERNAHDPYIAIFKRHAKGTPKDPKTGMIEMFRATDEYLFDQTDPARIRAREEQKRRTEIQRQRDVTLATLNDQIIRLSELLSDPEVLPSDAPVYRRMYMHAKTVRDSGTIEEMSAFSQGTMAPTIKTLSAYVEKKSSERTHRVVWIVVRVAFAFLLFVFMLVWLVRRVHDYLSLKERLAKAILSWEEKVRNASAQYMKFYEERQWAFALENAVGQTAELFKAVTKEVDEIYALVRAMEERVSKCKTLAKQVLFLRTSRLQWVWNKLTKEMFEFDTDVLNESDLFAKETKSIQVDPRTFEMDLRDRFKRSIDGWKRLKDAAVFQETIVADALPGTNLDRLFAKAREYGISNHWLKSHPLFGDDASDRVFYDEMDALRLSDPLEYWQKVNDFRDLESKLEKMLARLVDAVVSVRSARLDTPPVISGAIVDPGDDPMIAYANAQREDDKLLAYLQTSDAVESIERQAEKVVRLYRECVEKREVVQGAVRGATDGVERAQKEIGSLLEIRSDAESARKRAEAVHAKCDASSFILAGDKFVEEAKRKLEKAKRQLGEHRYVNARRTAEESLVTFGEARSSYRAAIKHCNALDEQKRDFEKKLASMESSRQSTVKKVKGYGRDASRVSAYREPDRSSDLVDYTILLGVLSAQEHTWAEEERSARREYEAEQAEIRRQEAAEAARVAAAAEEARRQESYSRSHWSDNSSSASVIDFSGGSSSSSVTDW